MKTRNSRTTQITLRIPNDLYDEYSKVAALAQFDRAFVLAIGLKQGLDATCRAVNAMNEALKPEAKKLK